MTKATIRVSNGNKTQSEDVTVRPCKRVFEAFKPPTNDGSTILLAGCGAGMDSSFLLAPLRMLGFRDPLLEGAYVSRWSQEQLRRFDRNYLLGASVTHIGLALHMLLTEGLATSFSTVCVVLAKFLMHAFSVWFASRAGCETHRSALFLATLTMTNALHGVGTPYIASLRFPADTWLDLFSMVIFRTGVLFFAMDAIGMRCVVRHAAIPQLFAAVLSFHFHGRHVCLSVDASWRGRTKVRQAWESTNLFVLHMFGSVFGLDLQNPYPGGGGGCTKLGMFLFLLAGWCLPLHLAWMMERKSRAEFIHQLQGHEEEKARWPLTDMHARNRLGWMWCSGVVLWMIIPDIPL